MIAGSEEFDERVETLAISNPPSSFEATCSVWIDCLDSDQLYFDESDGKVSILSLTGNICDPYQHPSGDIWEHIGGSDFSFKPLNIMITENQYSISESVKEKLGNFAIGSITTKESLEVGQWEDNGKTYTIPAVTAYVELSGDAIDALREQLSRCQSENRLLILTLRFIVLEDQIKPGTKLSNRHLGLPLDLADIDISKSQYFGILKFETAVASKEYRPHSGRSLAPINLETSTTRVYVIIEQSRAKYEFRYGNFEVLQISGKVNSKHDVSVDIELHEIGTDIDEVQNLGSYSFYVTENRRGDHLSLTLHYHADDFRKLILPMMLSRTADRVLLSVQLEHKLDFTEKKSGVVYSFDIDLSKEYIAKGKIDYEEKFEQIEAHLKSMPTIIGEHINATISEHRDAADKEFLDSINRQIQLMSTSFDKFEQRASVPNDVVSKLLFKIPLVGRLIKWLIK